MTALDGFRGIESNFPTEPSEDYIETKSADVATNNNITDEVMNNNVTNSSSVSIDDETKLSNDNELENKPKNSKQKNISNDNVLNSPIKSEVLNSEIKSANKENEQLQEIEEPLQVPSENSASNLIELHESETGEPTNESEKDEWLDIIGSGDFKKKIINPGCGAETRPNRGDIVTINVTIWNDNDVVVEQHDHINVILGDMDVIQGLELALSLMEKGEKALILIPSRLAYGKIGRLPEIPPECHLKSEVELLEVKTFEDGELSLSKRLELGHDKRSRGNFFYERKEYLNAIHCYERAAEYLDGVQNCVDHTPQQLQEVLDVRIKVYNNMAATHLKLEAYDAALKSVEFVLKIQSKNVKAHFRKGKILAAKGLTEEAIASMQTAASLDPDTKVLQKELAHLLQKKKQEEKSQKAMYQRMFGQSNKKLPPPKKSWLKQWCLAAGGVLAVAFSMVAYRQFSHS